MYSRHVHLLPVVRYFRRPSNRQMDTSSDFQSSTTSSAYGTHFTSIMIRLFWRILAVDDTRHSSTITFGVDHCVSEFLQATPTPRRAGRPPLRFSCHRQIGESKRERFFWLPYLRRRHQILVLEYRRYIQVYVQCYQPVIQFNLFKLIRTYYIYVSIFNLWNFQEAVEALKITQKIRNKKKALHTYFHEMLEFVGTYSISWTLTINILSGFWYTL